MKYSKIKSAKLIIKTEGLCYKIDCKKCAFDIECWSGSRTFLNAFTRESFAKEVLKQEIK
jgi:hypothetical protein